MSDDRDEQQRQRDRAITLTLRGASWELEETAHKVPAGRMDPEAWQELLAKLDYLRDLIRQRMGDTNGPAIEHVPSTPDTE
jgi:hypothetical protein